MTKKQQNKCLNCGKPVPVEDPKKDFCSTSCKNDWAEEIRGSRGLRGYDYA